MSISTTEVPFRVLDLNLLRVFDALLAESSVAGAAARLNITPSAVSHALSRLRFLFKDPLFVRSSRGMLATPRACEIGPKVRDGLRQLEIALAPVDFAPGDSSRTFTIACSAYVCAVLLPSAMSILRRRAPGTNLAVRPWMPGIIEQFEAGQIDLLIGDFLRVPEGFESELLFVDRPVWLMGRDYVVPKPLRPGLPAREAPSVGSFMDRRGEALHRTALEGGFERRVALDEFSCVVGIPLEPTDTMAADGQVRRPTLASIPYSAIAPLIVKHADMTALVPRRFALLYARSFDLDVIETGAQDGLMPIRISAVWQRELGSQLATRWLLDVLQESARLPNSGVEPETKSA